MPIAQLPVVAPLDARLTPASVFERFAHWPHRIWLDSANQRHQSLVHPIGRYSFVAADPIDWWIADPASDPWQHLGDWARCLPDENTTRLPPFQGGLAGMIGYEAGALLEPCGVSASNDLPTPVMAMGVYDWVVAFDHVRKKSWLISQGFAPERLERSVKRAVRRFDRIHELLATIDLDRQQDSATHERDQADDVDERAIELTSNFSADQYVKAVRDIVSRIRGGDSFQVNFAQRLMTPALTTAETLYASLRKQNAAPYSGFFDGGEFQVLSSSPEGFLKVREREVETRPIKGTAARTGDASRDAVAAAELLASEKDRAENVMIVDLMRNDLSRVCEDDSVFVEQLCGLEEYSFVQHLVSVIRGRLREATTIVDLLRCSFPGGSITGAPKIEAMRTIAELEPHRRGPYCGSLGYISSQSDAEFNILIRTITATAGQWFLPVGGGITARSDADAELAETWIKAEGMIAAIREVSGSRSPSAPHGRGDIRRLT